MKLVSWTDGKGWEHRAAVRDDDDRQVAIDGQGLPMDPPDIELLDWEAVKRDLHNQLLRRRHQHNQVK